MRLLNVSPAPLDTAQVETLGSHCMAIQNEQNGPFCVASAFIDTHQSAAHNGREDRAQSFRHGLASVDLRWCGRSVGVWDPA